MGCRKDRGGQIFSAVEQEAVLFQTRAQNSVLWADTEHLEAKDSALVLSSSGQWHLIPLIMYLLKQRYFYFIEDPNQNELHTMTWQSTQEFSRGKICSVNYQQFCPFIFSIGSNLECS